MTINIQFVNLDYSDAIAEHTNAKLKKLAEKYDWLINADVFFKEENNSPEKNKVCNIKLSLPGPQIFATSNDKNYEAALKETISDLEIQLKKRKQTYKTHQ